jgi:hypothetical protein
VRVLFCSDPRLKDRPDRAFAREVEAAERAGLKWSRIDHEALVAGDVARALRRVDELDAPEVAIYRGRRLRASTYERLHEGLRARGWRLIDDPAAYRSTHHLVDSLPFLAADTPRTVAVPLGPEFGWPAIHRALAGFGGQSVWVGDWTRTDPRARDEACFIHAADDRAEVERVVGNFIERRCEDLVGGVVFRAYEPLVDLGPDPASGSPLPREWRRFIADGEVIAESPAWDLADPGPPPPAFDGLLRRVPSRFFALDLVERSGGGWTALEVDDGQVAELPPELDATRFYQALVDWDPSVDAPRP